jgi:hypothetical protein
MVDGIYAHDGETAGAEKFIGFATAGVLKLIGLEIVGALKLIGLLTTRSENTISVRITPSCTVGAIAAAIASA